MGKDDGTPQIKSESEKANGAAQKVANVEVSPHFREAVSPFLEKQHIEEVRHWMGIAMEFGEECGPHGIHMVDFPKSTQGFVPPGWKVFFCFNEHDADHCVADITLLGADKPDKRIWDRVKSASGDAAFIAGRFFDGVFTVSGK